MARIVKEQEYDQRRNEILDSAQRFVYIKGYEQMSIQDILDDLKISKGAFYHYFDSKSALLEALTGRILASVMQIVQPIIENPELNAVQKLERYFETVSNWKTSQKDYILQLFRVWYTDENAVLRQRITVSTLKLVSPFINMIICQGMDEGIFHTRFPQELGAVVLTLLQGMGEAMAALILFPDPGEDIENRMVQSVGVYTASIERVLGLEPGTLNLVRIEDIRQWSQVAQI